MADDCPILREREKRRTGSTVATGPVSCPCSLVVASGGDCAYGPPFRLTPPAPSPETDTLEDRHEH